MTAFVSSGLASVTDFGFTLCKILLYSAHSTFGKSSILSFSCCQAFLAGKRHAVELSSDNFSLSAVPVDSKSEAFKKVVQKMRINNILFKMKVPKYSVREKVN